MLPAPMLSQAAKIKHPTERLRFVMKKVGANYSYGRHQLQGLYFLQLCSESQQNVGTRLWLFSG